MSDLPREILDDLNTQRFQENVAKKIKKSQLQQDLSNTNLTNGLSALSLSLQNLQSQVNNLPSSTYEDHTLTIIGNATGFFNHGLGSIPAGWAIIDKKMGGGAIFFDLTRTSWSSSTINFSQYDPGTGASCTYIIRVYK